MSHIGDLIKLIRKPKTQKQFAKLFGVHAQCIYHWEKDIAPVPLLHIRRLVVKGLVSRDAVIEALVQDYRDELEENLE